MHTKDALCFGWQGEELAFGYSGGEVRTGVEGTPGSAHTTQQALLDVGAPGHCPAGDCWPVEKVFFKPTGK